MNNEQDEGRLDPNDIQERAYSMGISEFARQEEDGNDVDCTTPMPPEGVLDQPSSVLKLDEVGVMNVGAEYDMSDPANALSDLEEACPADMGVVPTPCDFGSTKDTNPKDGFGSLKPSYSCVPVPVLYELGAALSEGARKYGGYNWRVAGVRASIYIDAARRHLDSFWEGEDIDPDSGLSHITKAIASLTVFRDAQIQGMVANDDRPPRTEVDFMQQGKAHMTALALAYPKPKPAYTQAEVAHKRNTPVAVNMGQTLGYDIEVMLPADGHPDGFVWTQQGSRRTDLDQALAIVQALREDGYRERIIRIMRAADRVELMEDQTEWIAGELREALTTVFPGDPSLTALTEEEAADPQWSDVVDDGELPKIAKALPETEEN